MKLHPQAYKLLENNLIRLLKTENSAYKLSDI